MQVREVLLNTYFSVMKITTVDTIYCVHMQRVVSALCCRNLTQHHYDYIVWNDMCVLYIFSVEI